MARLTQKQRKELIVERFDLWAEFISAQLDSLDVCRTAYVEWQQRPEMIKSAKDMRKYVFEELKMGEYVEQQYEMELHRAETLVSFVENELKNGLPILHTHALIAQWSAFEALIYDVARLWVQCYPKKLDHNRLQDFKFVGSEFYAMNDYERLGKVMEHIENKAKYEKFGPARFNEVLDCVGLGGSIPEDISENIHRLTCVRNLVVHRSGIVDKDFKTQCYWKKCKVGERFYLDVDEYRDYGLSTVGYMKILAGRIYKKSGIEVIERTKKDD